MKTKTYRVSWEIDIEAKSKKEAAKKALAIQRNPDSIATFFSVREWKRGELPELILVDKRKIT